eukprot:746512-Hanusia_phi.AAC.2
MRRFPVRSDGTGTARISLADSNPAVLRRAAVTGVTVRQSLSDCPAEPGPGPSPPGGLNGP